MSHKLLRSLTVGLLLAASSAPAWAQSASISAVPAPPPPAPPAPPSTFDQWSDAVKKPAPWMTWGADLRMRNEYHNNILSLSDANALHEQDVIRYRGRVWTSITPATNLTVNARLSAEPREWFKPAFPRSYVGQTGMEWRYGIVDNLNLKWNNVLDQPLTITAGRQDIMLGDFYNWWLVADGTPGDGSWTFFLDSARLAYDASKTIKTKFDVIYIYQNALPDAWMPTLGRSRVQYAPGRYDYALTEQNEQGVIAYISNKSIKNVQLDGYFIYKRDDQELANGDNADIYTLGGKISGICADRVSYSLEGAYQFGTKQDPTLLTAYGSPTAWNDISAFGGNARVSYLFRDRLNNQAHLVYEYLSGDDPSTTGQDEMFDVLWGRWPRWSELYIYSYVNETSGKIAQMNNVQRVGAGWTLNPAKGMQLGAYYNAMFAPQSVPTRNLNPALFGYTTSNGGDFRGHYVQAVLKHTFNKHITAHLWGEFVWQGDYYAQRDLMTFLRAEVLFTF